ncbi:MAG: hypothetical protein OWU84_04300 [Firmicutes bacterium]|nr:hypothetical protein [Bacillota bacterium]
MMWLTVIAAGLIAGPTGLWALGVSPPAMVVLNIASLALTLRLFYVAARVATRRDLFYLGLIAGLLGGTMNQVILHLPVTASLATAFSQYASLGSILYRFDVVTHWWPFCEIALSALWYSGLALFMAHLQESGRHRRAVAKPDRNL